MGNALNQFKQKMKETQEKYKHDMEKQEQQHQKLMAQDETTFKESLETENKKYDSLKKIHDQEVKDIFENEENLAFIKQMRDFKKQWSSDHTVSKRKSTAAAMADATKKWVSKAKH